MLGKPQVAYRLLREIVEASLDDLREGCRQCGARGLQSDAYFLLAIIIRHWRGDCEEALRYAAEHLKCRKRGLYSLWTLNEVRATLNSIRKGIDDADGNATRTKTCKG
jgi:hypothetical protein